MTLSSVAILISSSNAPLSRSLRVCASDWISDPPVFWLLNSWNWLSTFSKWDFVEMEYPVRYVAAFKFPPMILRRLSDFFISAWMSIHVTLKVRPSRCCLMDVNNANMLSLMRHPLFLASTVSALYRNAHIWNASQPLLVTYYCWVTV